MERPNLFAYATSELSQDAVLCWMAALAAHQDADLQRVGRSFLAWLWNVATKDDIAADRVRLISAPKRQVDHIDILIEAAVDDAKVLFLIEDKTDTSQHSGQLERYAKSTSKLGARVVPIYFKTGHHFGVDLAAARAGYTVIGLKEWVAFLATQTARSDILDDYREYASKLLHEREEALELLRTPLGFLQFSRDFVQYEFVGTLADHCKEAIGGSAISRAANVGGTPWTQYRFITLPGALPGGVNEYIFHRLDKRQADTGKPAYYLSTRQYAVVKGDAAARRTKLERLAEYRQRFGDAVHDMHPRLTFSAPANDFKGANESEIGILFFDDQQNSTANVQDQFPAVHRDFVKRVAELRGVTYEPARDT
jgi:hypothetical protein